MWCSRCGTQVTDAANYCSNCGLRLKDDVQQESAAREQWEWCDIGHTTEYERMGSHHWYWARGVGPRGIFEAGRSSTFRSEPHNAAEESTTKAFYGLMAELLKDGWEPYWEDLQHFYEKRFRRRVRPANDAR